MMKCYDEPKVYTHIPEENVPDSIFSEYVARHTADEIVTYKTAPDGENLELCYFYPKDYDRSKKYPVFTIIHGGGWGSRNIMKDQTRWSGDYLGYLLRYYADRGFLGVIMTYGILKAGNGRELIDLCCDCQDGMNYIADHALEYGADLDRVILLGESAGGHLAGVMSTDSFFENRLPVKLAILVNPILNLLNDRWGDGCPESSDRPLLKGMTKQEIQMQLSPLLHIKDNNCDTLLVHGDSDTCVDPIHSVLFNRRMTQMGLNCELHLLKGANHAFLLREYYHEPAHTKLGVEIIDEYLKKHNWL